MSYYLAGLKSLHIIVDSSWLVKSLLSLRIVLTVMISVHLIGQDFLLALHTVRLGKRKLVEYSSRVERK